MILRYAGFAVPTDPNLPHAGDHAHLGCGVTAEPQTDPTLDVDDLPDVDFVSLSHYHGDHLDHRVESLDRGETYSFDAPAGRDEGRGGYRSTRPRPSMRSRTCLTACLSRRRTRPSSSYSTSWASSQRRASATPSSRRTSTSLACLTG